jgi:hypothetical protein
MRPNDFFGASPKTVLNKPFFHCQDQKAYNVDGGTSIADAWTKRTLNTVITNDIQGASLASDAVSLPAGTYYVEGHAKHIAPANNPTSAIGAIFRDGVKVLQGSTSYTSNSYTLEIGVAVSGMVTLTTTGVIDLRYYVGVSLASFGLGRSNSDGSVTDASIPSIYTDLKIWQLDRSLEIAPKAINAPLSNIAGVLSEGLMDGFDITTSGQVITVGKGACMDSTRVIPMVLTSNATWTVAGTNNLEQYLFVVRLVADGSFTVKGYTTFAGPSSDPLIDYYRFISWAKNNGSGVLMPYGQTGDLSEFKTSEMPIVTGSTTTSYVEHSLSAVVPVSLCKELIIWGGAGGGYIVLSYDGTTNHKVLPGFSGIGAAADTIVSSTSIYVKHVTNGGAVKIGGLKLRR